MSTVQQNNEITFTKQTLDGFELKDRQSLAYIRFTQYCTDIKGMLLLHNVGSGKTLTSLNMALRYIVQEHELKKETNKSTNENASQNRIVVVVPTGLFISFKDDMKRNIAGIEFEEQRTENKGCNNNGLESEKYRFKYFDLEGEISCVLYKDLNRRAMDNGVYSKFSEYIRDSIVIFDEAHRLLRPSSANKNISFCRDILHYKSGIMNNCKKFILMTGTPLNKSISDIKEIISFVSQNTGFLDLDDMKYGTIGSLDIKTEHVKYYLKMSIVLCVTMTIGGVQSMMTNWISKYTYVSLLPIVSYSVNLLINTILGKMRPRRGGGNLLQNLQEIETTMINDENKLDDSEIDDLVEKIKIYAEKQTKSSFPEQNTNRTLSKEETDLETKLYYAKTNKFELFENIKNSSIFFMTNNEIDYDKIKIVLIFLNNEIVEIVKMLKIYSGNLSFVGLITNFYNLNTNLNNYIVGDQQFDENNDKIKGGTIEMYAEKKVFEIIKSGIGKSLLKDNSKMVNSDFITTYISNLCGLGSPFNIEKFINDASKYISLSYSTVQQKIDSESYNDIKTPNDLLESVQIKNVGGENSSLKISKKSMEKMEKEMILSDSKYNISESKTPQNARNISKSKKSAKSLLNLRQTIAESKKSVSRLEEAETPSHKNIVSESYSDANKNTDYLKNVIIEKKQESVKEHNISSLLQNNVQYSNYPNKKEINLPFIYTPEQVTLMTKINNDSLTPKDISMLYGTTYDRVLSQKTYGNFSDDCMTNSCEYDSSTNKYVCITNNTRKGMFACNKFEFVLTNLLFMKSGFLLGDSITNNSKMTNNTFKPQAHFTDNYYNSKPFGDCKPTSTERPLTINNLSATHGYLPIVYSTSDNIGLDIFGCYLNSLGLNYILIHDLDNRTNREIQINSGKNPVNLYLKNNNTNYLEFFSQINEHVKRKNVDPLFENIPDAIKNEPVCILLHSSITEGVDFKYNPAIFLLEPPNSFCDYEQLCGRVLRTYPTNYSIRGNENDNCVLPTKIIYQCICYVKGKNSEDLLLESLEESKKIEEQKRKLQEIYNKNADTFETVGEEIGESVGNALDEIPLFKLLSTLSNAASTVSNAASTVSDLALGALSNVKSFFYNDNLQQKQSNLKLTVSDVLFQWSKPLNSPDLSQWYVILQEKTNFNVFLEKLNNVSYKNIELKHLSDVSEILTCIDQKENGKQIMEEPICKQAPQKLNDLTDYIKIIIKSFFAVDTRSKKKIKDEYYKLNYCTNFFLDTKGKHVTTLFKKIFKDLVPDCKTMDNNSLTVFVKDTEKRSLNIVNNMINETAKKYLLKKEYSIVGVNEHYFIEDKNKNRVSDEDVEEFEKFVVDNIINIIQNLDKTHEKDIGVRIYQLLWLEKERDFRYILRKLYKTEKLFIGGGKKSVKKIKNTRKNKTKTNKNKNKIRKTIKHLYVKN